MQKTIPAHGNPETKVFGLKGSVIGTDLGKLFVKQGQDTLNVGWAELTSVATTTSTTSSPTTTTSAGTTTTSAGTTTTSAGTTTTSAGTTTTSAGTTTTGAGTTTTSAGTTTTSAGTTTTSAGTTTSTTNTPPTSPPTSPPTTTSTTSAGTTTTGLPVPSVDARGLPYNTPCPNGHIDIDSSGYFTGYTFTSHELLVKTAATEGGLDSAGYVSMGVDTTASNPGVSNYYLLTEINTGNTPPYWFKVKAILTTSYGVVQAESINYYFDPASVCGTTTTSAGTTTTSAGTTTTSAGTTTTSAGTTTTGEGTTTTGAGTTTTGEGTTTTGEGTTTTGEGTTTTSEGTTTTGAVTTTTPLPCVFSVWGGVSAYVDWNGTCCGGTVETLTINPGEGICTPTLLSGEWTNGGACGCSGCCGGTPPTPAPTTTTGAATTTTEAGTTTTSYGGYVPPATTPPPEPPPGEGGGGEQNFSQQFESFP